MSDVQLHNTTSQSILKTLLYYDIFHYPLTSKEVFKYLSTNHVIPEEVNEALSNLSSKKYIFNFGEFYCLQNNSELADRRIKGNTEAQKFMNLAYRKGRFINSFPFVRSVMASGSLSKNYMDEKSDLDFFIITAPDRLWIARTLLVLYKRIFLHNSHKYFCVNYFVDYNHLEIEEKNIFTATELATLIPLSGNNYYLQLFEKNNWIEKFFPNYQLRSEVNANDSKSYGLRSALEWLINLLGGTWWDTLFMNITNLRWRKIYAQKYDSEDFQIAFKTKKYTSKNHPNHYQKKIVNLYQEKQAELARKFDIQWLHE